MELENIIYIVITIVIFIISFLGNKKKAQPVIEDDNSEQTEYSLNDFEKILERTEITEQKTDVTEEISFTNEEKIDNIPENYHFTEDEAKNKKEKKNVSDENEDGFDLKSAIVYSSILERKKYRH